MRMKRGSQRDEKMLVERENGSKLGLDGDHKDI